VAVIAIGNAHAPNDLRILLRSCTKAQDANLWPNQRFASSDSTMPLPIFPHLLLHPLPTARLTVRREPRGGSSDEPSGATSTAGPTTPATDPDSRVGSTRMLGKSLSVPLCFNGRCPSGAPE